MVIGKISKHDASRGHSAIAELLVINTRKHTSSGSSFTNTKYSCITSADPSPLTHSVVQEPSVSVAGGTVSKY